MKITLVVLFLAGLTIYCKCAAVLSLPPSLIAHAASLDESLKAQKPYKAKDNESQQHLLAKEEEEDANESVWPVVDLYRNLKNLWHNDLSLSLQKREQRNTFDDDDDDDHADDDIGNVAAMQQAMATIKKNNQNQNSLRPHDNDNAGYKNYNHNNNNNNNNKNENNILKTAGTSSLLPLPISSAATNMNEATNLNMQLHFPSQNVAVTEVNDDTNELLYASPEMIDDIFVSPPHQTQEPLQLKRRELENMPLATAAAATEDSPLVNRFLKSAKYWPSQCALEDENNCLQEYYGAIIADRNNALLQQLHHRQNSPIAEAEEFASLNYNNNLNDDDIVLLLSAEQYLKQFLSWALSQLYPYGKFSNVTDKEAADYYHPGMYIWKKLNLSGRVEPPLLIDEPHYVIVRREYDQTEDDNEYKRGLNYGKEPFIPPRGRKHNLPDLDSLLQRYETFVPNRGRRDKIKDIFKYDDLFYPNRGKRQMTTAANDNERSDDNDIHDIKENQHYYNNGQNVGRHDEMQPPLLSNEQLMAYIENLMAKMKRKLHQQPKQQRDEKLANISDEIFNRSWPATKMTSTFYQQAPPAAAVAKVSAIAPAALPPLLKKRFKSMINILHNYKKPQRQHVPNHSYNARRQLWKRYMLAKTSSTQPAANSHDEPMPAIRSPTTATATNRLQKFLKSMSPPQQQIHANLSPPHLRADNKFMWPQQKSLAQHVDPLSWHKLQLLLQHQLQQQQQQQQQLPKQYHHRLHQPLLALRHPRLTALQHLPAIQQQHQQQAQQQQLQLVTPQETQLTYFSADQPDNSITNDLDNLYNKDLD